MINPESITEGRQRAEPTRFLYHATENTIKSIENVNWLKSLFEKRKRIKKDEKKKVSSSTPVPVPVPAPAPTTGAQAHLRGFSIHACTNFKVSATFPTPELSPDCRNKNPQRYEELQRLRKSVPSIIAQFHCMFEDEKLLFINSSQTMRYGTYGIVAYYKAKSVPTYVLCVKHTADIRDFRAVQRFQKHKVLCGQVPATIINSGSNSYYHTVQQRNGKKHNVYAYAMPVYEGTLQSFVNSTQDGNRLSEETLEKIIVSLHKQLKCLQNHEDAPLCYMDIKPANILYKLDRRGDNTSIQVTLGDLGSENVSTYHCPFSINTQFPDCKVDKEQYCIEYNLIIMLATLYYKPKDLKECKWTLYSQNPQRYKNSNPQKINESIKGYFKRIRNQVIKDAEGFVERHFINLEGILLPWKSERAQRPPV